MLGTIDQFPENPRSVGLAHVPHHGPVGHGDAVGDTLVFEAILAVLILGVRLKVLGSLEDDPPIQINQKTFAFCQYNVL